MLLAQHDSGAAGIRACSADEVLLISGQTLRSSFLLSASGAVPWPLRQPNELVVDDLSLVIAAQPDIFLLGTGSRQKFPAPAVMAACLSRRIGIEVMDNAAAARTYNVLSSERRNVLLGMILPGSGSSDAQT